MALLMFPRVVVDPLEGGCQGSLATGSGDDGLMDASGVADAGETAQTVTDDGAGGIEIALRQGGDFGPAETLDAAQLQAAWLTLWCGFDRRHNRRLAGRTAAPLAAVALAAEIGVIHLDPSRQSLCGIPLHHYLHEFVLDLPGCGLGNTKPAAQLDAGNASLALGQVVHGAKPGAQRHFGRGENRPSDQRCLPSTGGTLVKRAGFDHAVTLPAADRANEAGGPAPAEHLLATLFLGPIKNGKPSLTEALLELDLVARHRSAPQNSHMFVFCTPICWLRIVRNQVDLCRRCRFRPGGSSRRQSRRRFLRTAPALVRPLGQGCRQRRRGGTGGAGFCDGRRIGTAQRGAARSRREVADGSRLAVAA